MAGGDEVELKLSVDPQDADRLLASPMLSGSREAEQTTVYFDTAACTIRKAGFTVRVRRAGESRTQTIKADGKAAAGLFVRPEWEEEIDGDRPRLDRTRLPALFPSATELADLGPAFTATVTRCSVDRVAEGHAIELVLDRGQIVAEEAAEPICEVELELKNGPASALFALARELDAFAPVRPGALSKADRGYRLIDGSRDRAMKAMPIALTADMSAAEGFRAIAQACLSQFEINREILARTADPDAVHQARVAIRRLRSAMSTFGKVIDDDRSAALQEGLRTLAGSLGAVRDIDVLVERVRGSALEERLVEARDRAFWETVAALDAPPGRGLMIDLVEWLAIGRWCAEDPRSDSADRPIREFASDALDRARRRLKRAGRGLASLDDHDRHRARIAAKKLRYAAEFFAPLFDARKAVRRRKAFLRALETLQDDLGALNDRATAPVLLERLGLAGFGEDARSSRGRGRKALLARAEEANETLVDAKRFWR